MIIIDDQLDLENISVAGIALSFPHAIEILTRYNLDYCCGGKKSFAKVCKMAGLNPQSIWDEIQLASICVGPDSRMRYDTWEAPLLIDFIIEHHHHFVRDSIPQIQALLNTVSNVHGHRNSFLFSVRDKFSKLAEELLGHLQREEERLFPAIRKAFRASISELEPTISHRKLKSLVIVMEDEHEMAGQLIKSIRKLTNNYTLPALAYPTLELTYIMLSQFDKDLIQYIHLENNILFPKAMGVYSNQR